MGRVTILSGPNNLMGRHSLERLWPNEFKAFKNVCEPKVVNTNSGSLTNKISVQEKPMKKSDDKILANSNSVQSDINAHSDINALTSAKVTKENSSIKSKRKSKNRK